MILCLFSHFLSLICLFLALLHCLAQYSVVVVIEDIIILTLNLFMWWISLTDMLILNNFCITGINPTWLWCINISVNCLFQCGNIFVFDFYINDQNLIHNFFSSYTILIKFDIFIGWNELSSFPYKLYTIKNV